MHRRYGRRVKWWDETFWATAVISLVTVALTVAGTLFISWKILNRQLAHERTTQDELRQQQLADLRAELGRSRRVRNADGLLTFLGGWYSAVQEAAAHYHPAQPGGYSHDGRLEKVGWSNDRLVSTVDAVASTPDLVDALTKLGMVSHTWVEIGKFYCENVPPAGFAEEFREVGALLASAIEEMRDALGGWEDDGVLPSFDWQRLDEFVAKNPLY